MTTGTRILAWIGALLSSALAPSVIFAALLSFRVLPAAFALALGHSLVLGLPVALVCRAKRWTGLRAAIAAGLLIGAIPGGALMACSLTRSHDGTASIDDVPTIAAGLPTPTGWLVYLALVAMLGGLGVAGSIVFWLVLKRSNVLGPTSATTPRRIGFAATIAGAAIVASIAIAAMPADTQDQDRTCHNLLRDGRRSITPKAVIELDIKPPEWPTLATLFQQFGTAHGLSFRNSNESHPGIFETLGLSLCTEPGLAIASYQYHFLYSKEGPPAPATVVSIAVYAPDDGAAWRSLTRDFAAALDSQWPGKVGFRHRDGGFTPMDEARDPPSR